MAEARYYDVSILLIDRNGTKTFDSLIIQGNSKFEARKKAEDYILKTYNNPQWKIKKVFSVKDSAYSG